MKVKKLISELKKMPQDAQVFTIDHDQNEWEQNTLISQVSLRDQSKMDEGAQIKLKMDPHFAINEPYVTLG